MNKGLIRLTLVLSLAAALGACGGETTSPTSPSPGSPASTTTPPASSPSPKTTPGAEKSPAAGTASPSPKKSP